MKYLYEYNYYNSGYVFKCYDLCDYDLTIIM